MTDEPRAGGQAVDRDELALEIKVALVRQALEDPEYRRLALRDPKAAVSRNRFIGDATQLLPARLGFRVVEETPERLYLVIPHQPVAQSLDPDNPKDILLQKAMRDRAYLDRLVADPRSVIEAEFLVEVPPGFEVAVLRETPQERIAVLPAHLRPEQITGVREDLLEYQSSAWGGGDCKKSFLGSIIENLCPHGPDGPADTVVQSPNCTTSEPQCQMGPSGVGAR